MVNSLVERASSDMLIGPDWAMNLEICDILNRDPGQAKDVVKGLKKRIGHKNSKIQLLALTLLETIMKNCGDIVHMHVAEKDVLHEMMRIIKKKPDFHVKEKILILIDTWQEAFGGPRARYPQYYAAYQELLRIGAVFPQRPERGAPLFTPPRLLHPQNIQSLEYRQEATEALEHPNLSLTEIRNAHGILDVLSEMLNALDPANKEELKQEVILDLVEQCRNYKQRVVQLVNTTADEELLNQGLALNDDLQRVLVKHDTICKGLPVVHERAGSSDALVDIAEANKNRQQSQGSTSAKPASEESQSSLQQLLLPAPPASNASNASPVKLDPNMDLLSGDVTTSTSDITPSTSKEDSLALVPISEPAAIVSNTSPQLDMILLSDLYPEKGDLASKPPESPMFNTQPPSAQPVATKAVQSPVSQPSQYMQGPYSLGSMADENMQPSHAWDVQDVGRSNEGHQPPGVYDATASSLSLPPPPWESSDNIQNVSVYPVQQMAAHTHSSVIYPQPEGSQSLGLYAQQAMLAERHATTLGAYPHSVQGAPPFGIYSQSGQGNFQPESAQNGHTVIYPQQMHASNSVVMYPQSSYMEMPGGFYDQAAQNRQWTGYSYGQVPNSPYIEQRMHELSVQEDGRFVGNSLVNSQALPRKLPSPMDSMFGDLVDIAKSKSSKTNVSKTSS